MLHFYTIILWYICYRYFLLLFIMIFIFYIMIFIMILLMCIDRIDENKKFTRHCVLHERCALHFFAFYKILHSNEKIISLNRWKLTQTLTQKCNETAWEMSAPAFCKFLLETKRTNLNIVLFKARNFVELFVPFDLLLVICWKILIDLHDRSVVWLKE